MAIAFRFDLVTARISTLELPAAQFVVSSRPYPVELGDALVMGAALNGGALSTALYEMLPENMTLGVALSSGTLRVLNQTHAWPDENVTLGVALSSGELRQILQSYTNWPNENLTLSAGLSSGDMKVALINYTNWQTENVTLSATLDSGTLA